MKVLTKRASEQVVIDQPVRLIVLKTGPDKVELGLLDRGEDGAHFLNAIKQL